MTKSEKKHRPLQGKIKSAAPNQATEVQPESTFESQSLPQHILKHPTAANLTPGMVMQLQRLIGNRAVGRLLARTPSHATQHKASRKIQKKNNTGLPDNLKTGVEQLSGLAMDDVNVHYNSSEPGQLGAAAYTEGTDIHVGPGQEAYLPHESWHVVQQKQGRVTPSIQMKSFGANFDSALENEADMMGEKANNLSMASRLPSTTQAEHSSQVLGQPLVQRSGTPVRQYGGCKGSSKGTGSKDTSSKDTSPEPTLPEGKDIPDPKKGLDMVEGHWAEGWLAQNIGDIGELADNPVLQEIAETGEIIDVELAMKAEHMLEEKGIALTETRKVQVYYISDTTKKFYTATSRATAKLILETGLDPKYGGTRKEGDHTAYNSIGHVYFGMDRGPAQGYGQVEIGKSNMAILEFTLPAKHPVTIDPELMGTGVTALRTPRAIPAELITLNYPTQEVLDKLSD